MKEFCKYYNLERLNIMTQLEQDFYSAGIQFMENYQDQTRLIAELSARVKELEDFKKSIEKLPYYDEWVISYNCGGYQD